MSISANSLTPTTPPASAPFPPLAPDPAGTPGTPSTPGTPGRSSTPAAPVPAPKPIKLNPPKGKKKRKTPLDANAPKKPVSAYVLYLNERRERVKAENPSMSYPDILKMLAGEWSAASAEERKKYHEEANRAKEKYNRDIDEYKTTDLYKKFCEEKTQHELQQQQLRQEQEQQQMLQQKKLLQQQQQRSQMQQQHQLSQQQLPKQSPSTSSAQSPMFSQPQQVQQQMQHQQLLQRQHIPSELKRHLSTEAPPRSLPSLALMPNQQTPSTSSNFNFPHSGAASGSNQMTSGPSQTAPLHHQPALMSGGVVGGGMTPIRSSEGGTDASFQRQSSFPEKSPPSELPAPSLPPLAALSQTGPSQAAPSQAVPSQQAPKVESSRSYDIPIFTEEFLEHNRNCETELRNFKKHNTQLEEQNAMLGKHIDNMKSAITKLDAESVHQRSHNRNLQQQLDNLRSTLSLHLRSLPLPGTKEPPNRDNIDDYMNRVYQMMTESGQADQQHFFTQFKEIILAMDFVQN